MYPTVQAWPALVTHLLQTTDASGIVTLTLNRPERHNAFDGRMVAELTEAFGRAAGARALVLASTGPSFSAGADLEWMRAKALASHAENEADAAAVLHMLDTLNRLPTPTLAVVQGNAFGGAIGLLACCDIVLAAETARFAISEVRLGLSPTAIGPFITSAIGERQARRWFVTGEPIPAERALAIGLVHELAPLEGRAGPARPHSGRAPAWARRARCRTPSALPGRPSRRQTPHD